MSDFQRKYGIFLPLTVQIPKENILIIQEKFFIENDILITNYVWEWLQVQIDELPKCKQGRKNQNSNQEDEMRENTRILLEKLYRRDYYLFWNIVRHLNIHVI